MSYEQIAFVIIGIISVIVFLNPIRKLIKEPYYIRSILIYNIYNICNYFTYEIWRRKQERSRVQEIIIKNISKHIGIVDSYGNKIVLDTKNEQSIRKFLNVLEERKAYNGYTKKSEQQ